MWNMSVLGSFNFDNVVKFLSVNGIEPTSKVIKDDRFLKFVGIRENMFLKCSNSPNQSGMGPSKLLSSINKCSGQQRRFTNP